MMSQPTDLDLRDYIRSIPDFPKPGILFRDITPLLADWTDRSPMIKQALNDLGYNSIPLLAIWPAGGSDDDVIILTDLLAESQVIEALEKAGPPKPSGQSQQTATAGVPPRF